MVVCVRLLVLGFVVGVEVVGVVLVFVIGGVEEDVFVVVFLCVGECVWVGDLVGEILVVLVLGLLVFFLEMFFFGIFLVLMLWVGRLVVFVVLLLFLVWVGVDMEVGVLMVGLVLM